MTKAPIVALDPTLVLACLANRKSLEARVHHHSLKDNDTLCTWNRETQELQFKSMRREGIGMRDQERIILIRLFTNHKPNFSSEICSTCKISADNKYLLQ